MFIDKIPSNRFFTQNFHKTRVWYITGHLFQLIWKNYSDLFVQDTNTESIQRFNMQNIKERKKILSST